MRKLLLGVLVLCVSVSAWAQTTHHQLTSGGESRSYELHVPSGLSSASALVVVLHGGMGSGLQVERGTRFSQLADREKFVVAYPNGLRRQWNDGRSEVGAQSDDVAFVRATIADIEKQVKIDPRRVFVTGMSNGAAMTSRMACDASDIVRGIAPVSNTMKAEMLATCKPKHSMPVIEFHGIDDPVVPYSGGKIVVFHRNRGKVISVAEYSQFWAKTNGCKPEPKRSDLPVVVDDGTSVIKDEYQGCRAPVVLYSIRSGGHAWPGGVGHIRLVDVGKTSHQIDATKMIWDFFKQQK